MKAEFAKYYNKITEKSGAYIIPLRSKMTKTPCWFVLYNAEVYTLGAEDFWAHDIRYFLETNHPIEHYIQHSVRGESGPVLVKPRTDNFTIKLLNKLFSFIRKKKPDLLLVYNNHYNE
jgi:hypothetical protein